MNHQRQGITQKHTANRRSCRRSRRIRGCALLLLLLLFTGCNPQATDHDALHPGDTQPDGTQSAADGQQPNPPTANEPPTEPTDTPDASTIPGNPTPPKSEHRTADDGDLFVLVNKTYTVSADYTPIDMVDVDGALSTNQNLKLKKDAYNAYLAMLEAAEADGINFCICSAYRDYATQKSIYETGVANYGEDYAGQLYAKPGKSEHHTGYAIDLTSASMHWGLSQDFADLPEGKWVSTHCAEYGFILRYLKGKEDITGYMYEPWHIRYVGKDVARYITDHDLTFEEYLGVA